MKNIIVAITLLSSLSSFAGDACKGIQDDSQDSVVKSKIYEDSRSYWVGVGQSNFGTICKNVINMCREDGYQDCEKNYNGWSYDIMRGATVGQKCTTFGTKTTKKEVSKLSICQNLSNCLISLLDKSEISKEKVDIVKSLIDINDCKTNH